MRRCGPLLCLLLIPAGLPAQDALGHGGSVVERRLARLYYAGELESGVALADSALAVLAAGGKGADDVEAQARVRLLVARGRLLATHAFTSARPLDEALATLREAATLAGSLPPGPALADALVELGFAEYVQAFLTGGEFLPIRERFERSLAIARELGDSEREARALFHLGLIHERLGETDAGLRRYLEALAVADACGCLLVQSYAQRHVGFSLLALDLPRAALRHFERSLELRREVGFEVYLPYSLSGIADVLLELGDPGAAEPYAVEAVERAERLGHPRTRAVATLSLAEVRLALGDRTEARRLFGDVLELAGEIGYPAGVRAARDGLERAEGP